MCEIRRHTVALVAASGGGHTEVVTALLAAGASVDLNGKRNGMTALMTASAEGHTKTVAALLAAGASVDAGRHDNTTICVD